MPNNRLRAFSDVVSLDAWHEDFAENDGRARIFADVGFRTARVGSEPDCPLRFKLSLKRAEIHLIVPNSEPLRIDPGTVARTPSLSAITRSITTENSQKASRDTKLGANLTIGKKKGPTIAGSAARKRAEATQTKETVKETREVISLLVSCTISPEDNYRWEVESDDGTPLKGVPWEASAARATLIDESGQSKYGLAPSGVRFEARCASEDMVIGDIEVKDSTLWDRLKHGAFPQTKEMVVRQYIRAELTREGLEARNIEDKFGLVTLCAVTARD